MSSSRFAPYFADSESQPPSGVRPPPYRLPPEYVAAYKKRLMGVREIAERDDVRQSPGVVRKALREVGALRPSGRGRRLRFQDIPLHLSRAYVLRKTSSVKIARELSTPDRPVTPTMVLAALRTAGCPVGADRPRY